MGVTLVVIGLIGGLVPVFQGWMFGIPGLLILSEYFPGVRRLVGWAKAKAGWKHEAEAQGVGGGDSGSPRV
jgi:hypothetical protein